MQTNHSRRDWQIAWNWLTQSLPAESRILDTGCFDGGFLEPLIGKHQCYGIEIHPSARKRAEEKGVEIIGCDFSAISGTFDCITAFDVIEHMEHPQSFLKNCLAKLRPGGWFLVSSGNLDAYTFRLIGSRYWYCAIAEHISFVSPMWFSKLVNTLNYRIDKQVTFAHSNASLLLRIKQAVINWVYHLLPDGFRHLRRLGCGGKNVSVHAELVDHPPSWGSAYDHFMVLIQKR
jgi:2-polyprenyl-3-methyl-5-hydroxy-6-metoxy-1,4-benzoquinol methylase